MLAAIWSTSTILAVAALAAIVLTVLGVGIFLLSGLFQARSLLRREFSAYLLSPFAYVMLAVFLLVTGFFFYKTLGQLTAAGPQGTEHPMEVMLGDQLKFWWVFWLVFLLIPPLLTMRLFAEERSTGTLEMLMTAPLRDWQVVLTKYVACLGFYVVLWIPTLVYLPALLDLHGPFLRIDKPQITFSPVWTPYSILLLGGVGAVVLAAILALLPLGRSWRVVALVLFLVGAACAGVGGWCHDQFDTSHLVQLAPDSAWTPFNLLMLGGLAGILVSLLLAWLPFDTSGRVVALMLLITGVACAAVGGWANYRYDSQPLLEVPAGIDPMPVVTSYLGLFFAGAMFLALGMLVSSLVRSQLVAALISLVLSLVFIAAGFWRPELEPGSLLAYPVAFLHFLSVPLHFSQDFSRGLLNSRYLVLYGSVTVFCLFLTVRSLESRRWR
jgi:ABC-type transport system involved in multi-copper enzyme maturation permease subunit